MLALLFHIGAERFGLDARAVAEVVPYVELQPPAQKHDFLCGQFSYRGEATPVIDLGCLTGQGPCPALLSTRIIVVRHHDRLLGLIAEKVTETARISAHSQGKIEVDGIGSVQLLDLDRLLPAPILHSF